MIKVLLADDQQMFLDGMKAFLEQEPEIEIIGMANNGDQVLEILEVRPDIDVVVLDVEMPQKDGIETTHLIKQDRRLEKVKILILTMYNRKDFIVKLMEAGANGYILKNKSKEELVHAIYNIYEGRPHFGLEVLNSATSISSKLEKNIELTDRELETLCLIAEGKTTREISSLLFISEPTVNTHRRNLLRKLDFTNDKYLVRYAIKHGYVKL